MRSVRICASSYTQGPGAGSAGLQIEEARGSVRMAAVTDQRHIRYGASDRAGRSWIECTDEAIRHSEFGGVKDLTRSEQVQQAAIRSRRANG